MPKNKYTLRLDKSKVSPNCLHVQLKLFLELRNYQRYVCEYAL